MKTNQHSSISVLAKNIREALKNNFPGFKFSVRSKSYSMGASVDIDWVDGPTTKEVDQVVNGFEKVNRDQWGEILSGGNTFVMTHRDFSPEVETKVFNEIKEQSGLINEYETVEDYKKGYMDWDKIHFISKRLESTNLYDKSFYDKAENKKKVSKKENNTNTNTNTGYKIEYDRDWTWITFDNKPDNEILNHLRELGGRFSSKKMAWYFKNHMEESELSFLNNIIVIESENKDNQVEEIENKQANKTKDNQAMAIKLNKLADNMQKTIDNKLNPASASQNYTARRARIADSMYQEGYRLEKIQNILRSLASDYENNFINPLLTGITSKSTIENILYHSNSTMTCNSDSWCYEVRMKLEKQGITYNNFDEIKSLLLAKVDDNGQREKEKKQREAENKAKALIGKIPGFFPTPKEVCNILIKEACIENGDCILEPSAGTGNILDSIRDYCQENNIQVNLFAIEYNYTLREVLENKGYNLVGDDFMEYSNNNGPFMTIISNPPFENGQDIDHVKHSYDVIKQGGRIVSVMSTGPFYREDKKSREFREWLDLVGGYKCDLPQGSFKESLTGVNTCYVVINK